MKSAKNDFNFDGIYRAEVVDTKDPEGFGRIKVKLLGFDANIDLVAWAYPMLWASGISQTTPNFEGSFYIPPKGSFVYIIFENGNLNNIKYLGGVHVKETLLLPEAYCIGQDKVSVLKRWKDGKSIYISDDRITITGKKRKIAVPENIDETKIEEDVVALKENQSTISIIDGIGVDQEYIIIQDYKGNHIIFDIGNQKLFIQSESDIDIITNGKLNITTQGDINIKTTSNTNITANGDVNIKAVGNAKISASSASIRTSGDVAIDGATVQLNCGASTDAQDAGDAESITIDEFPKCSSE